MVDIPDGELEWIDLPDPGRCPECGEERDLIAHGTGDAWSFTKDCPKPEHHDPEYVKWWPFDRDAIISGDTLREMGWEVV